jgi:hypothetical protein
MEAASGDFAVKVERLEQQLHAWRTLDLDGKRVQLVSTAACDASVPSAPSH